MSMRIFTFVNFSPEILLVSPALGAVVKATYSLADILSPGFFSVHNSDLAARAADPQNSPGLRHERTLLRWMVVHVPLRGPPHVVVIRAVDAATSEVALETVPGGGQLTHVPLFVQLAQRCEHLQVQRDLMHQLKRELNCRKGVDAQRTLCLKTRPIIPPMKSITKMTKHAVAN